MKESATSEQSSRMTAMEGATKNAGWLSFYLEVTFLGEAKRWCNFLILTFYLVTINLDHFKSSCRAN